MANKKTLINTGPSHGGVMMMVPMMIMMMMMMMIMTMMMMMISDRTIIQINDGVLSAVPFPTACLQLMVSSKKQSAMAMTLVMVGWSFRGHP